MCFVLVMCSLLRVFRLRLLLGLCVFRYGLLCCLCCVLVFVVCVCSVCDALYFVCVCVCLFLMRLFMPVLTFVFVVSLCS